MKQMSSYCNVSILGMEYPGYGTYSGNGSASEEKIKEDAEYIYKFMISARLHITRHTYLKVRKVIFNNSTSVTLLIVA